MDGYETRGKSEGGEKAYLYDPAKILQQEGVQAEARGLAMAIGAGGKHRESGSASASASASAAS
jgi:hypothetical protein